MSILSKITSAKRLIFSRYAVMIAIAAQLFLGTCAYAADKSSAHDRVINSGTLKCGHGISPPVLIKDPNTGQLSGMDYEVWEAIGKILDLKIEWVESSGWGTFPEDLKQGKYDAYCSQIWMTPTRSKFLSVTQPVAYISLNAYVRPDETRFGKDLEVFNSGDIRIPALDGDISDHMARTRFPKASIYTLPGSANWGDMYLAVTSRKADVFFVDPASYEAVAKNNPVKLKKLDTPPVFTFGARYSVAQGEYGLRDMIDIALQNLIDNGNLAAMAKKTSPYLVTPDKNFTRTMK